MDHFCLAGGGIFVPEGFRLEFSLQAALTLKQAKACTPCQVRNSAQSSGLEFSLQAALTLKQAKACTPCQVRRSAQSSGLEFSLQAALTLSRLKPVLHARFGGQLRVQVWSSAFRL